MLKNPNSLQIHEIIIQNKDYFYVYIDYSAMNGFGGYNRSYRQFKFSNTTLLYNNEIELTIYDKNKLIEEGAETIDINLIDY